MSAKMHENGQFPWKIPPWAVLLLVAKKWLLISRLTLLSFCGGSESAFFDLDWIRFQYCIHTLPCPSTLCISLLRVIRCSCELRSLA